MKNKILVTISIIMAGMFLMGTTLFDSTGVAFLFAVLMLGVPVCWGFLIILANKWWA